MLTNTPLPDLLAAPLPLDAGLVTPPNPLDVALNPNPSSSSTIAPPPSPIGRVPLNILARFGLNDPHPRPIAPGLPPNWQVIGLPRAVPTPTVAMPTVAVPTVVVPTVALPPRAQPTPTTAS
jgi:hypothetical protein